MNMIFFDFEQKSIFKLSHIRYMLDSDNCLVYMSFVTTIECYGHKHMCEYALFLFCDLSFLKC